MFFVSHMSGVLDGSSGVDCRCYPLVFSGGMQLSLLAPGCRRKVFCSCSNRAFGGVCGLGVGTSSVLMTLFRSCWILGYVLLPPRFDSNNW